MKVAVSCLRVFVTGEMIGEVPEERLYFGASIRNTEPTTWATLSTTLGLHAKDGLACIDLQQGIRQ